LLNAKYAVAKERSSIKQTTKGSGQYMVTIGTSGDTMVLNLSNMMPWGMNRDGYAPSAETQLLPGID
jgi:hypothetical protein